MIKQYVLLGIAIVANAGANILMKMGMNRVGGMDISSFNDVWHKFVLNYVVWAGVAAFGIALVSYSYVLSHLQLSVAYPIMTSLGFVIVILASLFYLGEKLNLIQLFGILLIISGVWMVAQRT